MQHPRQVGPVPALLELSSHLPVNIEGFFVLVFVLVDDGEITEADRSNVPGGRLDGLQEDLLRQAVVAQAQQILDETLLELAGLFVIS